MWLCWRASSAAMAEETSGSRVERGAALSMVDESGNAHATRPRGKDFLWAFRGRRRRPEISAVGRQLAGAPSVSEKREQARSLPGVHPPTATLLRGEAAFEVFDERGNGFDEFV